MANATKKVGVIDPAIESQYAYGSRAGVWRVYKAFKDRDLPLTLVSALTGVGVWLVLRVQYGVASALVHNPKVTQKAIEYGWECGSHGARWIQHGTITPEEEEQQIRYVVSPPFLVDTCPVLMAHRDGLEIWRAQGPAPVGWFLGRPSNLSSYLVHKVYAEQGLPPLKWWSDLYVDDVPHWRPRPGGKPDEGVSRVSWSHVSPVHIHTELARCSACRTAMTITTL
jgi:hypothetical protein